MMQRATERCYRNTIVCVDSYEQEVMQGRICNCYFEGDIVFHSLMDFLKSMERMLDGMNYPQAYEEKRSFCRQPEDDCMVQKAIAHRGKKATFELKVFFRQNVSWQGSICWLEENQEESFRSALELCLLMDSALSK